MAARCYGLTLWQDGVKVRDFKPCVYKDKAMLYDEVSGKVYRPSPDIHANGGAGALVANSQPAVYVEYVETDGSQYVDTGVIGTADMLAQTGVATMYSSEVVNPGTIVSGKILGTF